MQNLFPTDINTIQSESDGYQYSNMDLMEEIVAESISNVESIINAVIVNPRISLSERPAIKDATYAGDLDTLLTLLHQGGHLEFHYIGTPDITKIAHITDVNSLFEAALGYQETPKKSDEIPRNNLYIVESLKSGLDMAITLIQQKNLGKQVGTREVNRMIVPLFESVEKGTVDLSLFFKSEVRAIIDNFLLIKSAESAGEKHPNDVSVACKRARI